MKSLFLSIMDGDDVIGKRVRSYDTEHDMGRIVRITDTHVQLDGEGYIWQPGASNYYVVSSAHKINELGAISD